MTNQGKINFAPIGNKNYYTLEQIKHEYLPECMVEWRAKPKIITIISSKLTRSKNKSSNEQVFTSALCTVSEGGIG